jgi:hypothetical protein
MAINRLAPPPGSGQLFQNLMVAVDHARKIHQLAQVPDFPLLQQALHRFGIQHSTGGFERCGRHATGRTEIKLERNRFAVSIMNSTPALPHTLAISCGSLTVATVPCGTASRANCAGTSMELSICTCASINPGTAYGRALFSPSPVWLMVLILPILQRLW